MSEESKSSGDKIEFTVRSLPQRFIDFNNQGINTNLQCLNMSNLHSESDNEASQLRERILTQSVGREETEKTEVNVASTEDDNDKLKSAKTYGRTSSGAGM